MEHLPKDIINELMQDMIGSYFVPRSSVVSNPDKPDKPDKPGSSKSQTKGNGADFQDIDYRSRDSSTDSRTASSKKKGSREGHADRQSSGSRSTSKERASNSGTEYSDYSWSKGVSGSEQKGFRQQGRQDRNYQSQRGGRAKPQTQRVNRAGRANGNNSQFFQKNQKKAQQSQVSSAASKMTKKGNVQSQKMWTERKKALREERALKLKAMMAEDDFLAKFGVQLMKWADLTGDHIFKNNPVRSELHTETFINMLTAFKSTLKKEHLKHCFSTVGEGLSHPGFKRPKLDDDIIQLVAEKEGPEAKDKFMKDINPLNKYMENIQHLLMMATIPLFLVCNAHEVNPMTASDSPEALSATLSQNILLCRRSLVLYGQTFSFISSLRQEMVLDALDLHAEPPPPSHYPNLDDAFLFGRNYMVSLRAWIKKGKPKLSKDSVTQAVERTDKAPQDTPEDKYVPVDSKTKDTIEKLARFVVEMGPEMEKFNKDRMASNPDFWFLTAKDTAAYKLYQRKLAEYRQPSGSSSDSNKLKDPKATICQDSQLKDQKQQDHKAMSSPLLQKSPSSVVVPKSYCFTPPLPPPPRKRDNTSKVHTVSTAPKAYNVPTAPKVNTVPTAPKAHAVPTKRIDQEKISKVAVDAKTRDTAEQLAQFVAQLGPEMERLNKAKLASYQEFWFLNLQECPAYKFYERKLTEFRQSKQIQPMHSKYVPLVLSKLLHHVRSTTIQEETFESDDSVPINPEDQVAEPQGALLLLSELYDSDDEDKSQDRLPQDGKTQVSQPGVTSSKNLLPQDTESKVPKQPQHKYSDAQNHSPQDHRPPESDPGRTGDEQSRLQTLVPKHGKHVAHCTDSDSRAPEPMHSLHKDYGLQDSGIYVPKPQYSVTTQPEVTQCSNPSAQDAYQNCDSQVSKPYNVERVHPDPQDPLPLNYEPSVSAPAELQYSKHHSPSHLVPDPQVLLGHEPHVSKQCTSSPHNCNIRNPVGKASEPPNPACTDFTHKDRGPQVPDPQELELMRFYQIIEETERAAEERKGSVATTQTVSSVPALSPSPQKRTMSETTPAVPRKKIRHVQKPEVPGPVPFENENPCGHPALKTTLSKDVDVSFHEVEEKKKQSLVSAEVRTKEPVQIATVSGEQSNEPSKEEKFNAFRQKMLLMFKKEPPK